MATTYACRQVRSTQLGTHPVFHNRVHFVLVHFDANVFHNLHHTNSEIPTVHPELVTLDRLGNGSERRTAFALQGRFDVGARGTGRPVLHFLGLLADFLFVQSDTLKERRDNLFRHVLFRIVLEQQFECRDHTQTPDLIPLEARVHDNQVRGSHQVCDHVLVEGIDREAQFFGEIRKGLSDRLDLGPDQVLEAPGEFSVGFTGLVVELLFIGAVDDGCE